MKALVLALALIGGPGLLGQSGRPHQPIGFSIPDLGGTSLRSAGTAATLITGYAAIQPGNGTMTPSGLAIFGLRDNNVLISESSVPATSLIQSGRIYAEVNDRVNTGLAIANPNDQPAVISFSFTDSSGDFGNGSATIPANGQIAAFLNQSPFSSIESNAMPFRTFNNTAAFNLAAGNPAIAIDFDSTAAGTNITGSTIKGVTFTSLGSPLNVVAGASTYTPANLYDGILDAATNKLWPTSGANVLSPGGSFLGPGDDPSVEHDSLSLTFATPLSALGFDVLFQSLDCCTISAVYVYDASNALLFAGELPGNGGEGGDPGGSDFVGFVSSTANIARVDIIESDNNNVYPDNNIGYDTFRFASSQGSGIAGRSSMSGTFTFHSSIPVAALALRGLTNERSEFLFSAMPVTDITTPPAQETVVLPHFAHGDGWTTQIVLFNPTDGVLTGTVDFRDPQGQIVTARLFPASTVTYSIPPRDAQKLQTSGGNGSFLSGSVRVVPAPNTAAPSGTAVFSLRNGGVTVAEAGVAAALAGSAFRLYAEATGDFGQAGSIQTGIAVANSSASSALVSLELSNLDSSPTGLTGTLVIPSNGQVAAFLNQIPGFQSLPAGFRGILRVKSAASLSVVGVRGRYNEKSDFLFTTTPPVNEADTPATEPRYFPHIVDSGSYTTQFILFGGQPGPTLSGTIQLFSQSGADLDLTLRP